MILKCIYWARCYICATVYLLIRLFSLHYLFLHYPCFYTIRCEFLLNILNESTSLSEDHERSKTLSSKNI